MEEVLKIYEKYKIMPTLAEHQIRVAGVAKMICDSISIKLNTESVIKVCLFHDMGNIIKSDLNYFPDFLKPQGLEYWQKVKDDFVAKYGNNEHVATERIFREIGLSDIEIDYLNNIGLSKTKTVFENDSLEKKICCYSDQRVGPYGVLSIKERLAEGRKRYSNRKDKIFSFAKFEETSDFLMKLEEQIFSYSNIKPEDISDISIKNNFFA